MAPQGHAERPSGTVIFLFTDVVGSTRLWSTDEDAMSASLARHDEVIRGTIDAHQGVVFATAGDSFGGAFWSASQALRAAEAIHAGLADVEWPGPALSVRIGVHLGDAELRDGTYFGAVVNTAARVEEAGHGGQTLLTEAVRVAARATDARDLGLHRLRDVDELMHLHQIGTSEFPPLRSGDRAKALPTASGLPTSWIILHQPGEAPRRVELTSELTIGREVGRPVVAGHLATRGDPTVSRLHGLLTPKPAGWCIQATNSRNGLFVNGSRLAEGSVNLLQPGDEVRLGERTSFMFHSLTEAADRESTETARPMPELTPGERRVLLSLCAPVLDGDAFTPPATVSAIADELFVSQSAVKQHLGHLYDKFGVEEGTDRRSRLASDALACGAVRLVDLRSLRDERWPTG